MSGNPYESSVTAETSSAHPSNHIGTVGFLLSLAGTVGVVIVGPFGPIIANYGAYVAFLSVPGLFVSLLGLTRPPRRLSAYGAILGGAATLFVATLHLPIQNLPD